MACASLCPDPKFVPGNGLRYIAKINGIMQLESAVRALDNHRVENGGFNRGNSILAVVFITDEDDCSVQTAQRSQLNPATPNASMASCTTPTPTPGVAANCFNVDYRCMARDLTCAEPMNTTGAKTNCKERTDTFLNPIDGYVRFFKNLPNPGVIIAGIWTPTMLDNPTSNPAKDGQLDVEYVGFTDASGLNRGQTTKAACYNSTYPGGLIGQAQLRLSSFIRNFSTANTNEQSICDVNNYPTSLSTVATKIVSKFGVDCMPAVPKTSSGTPQCMVGYIDAATPNAKPDVTLPACSATCCNYFATDSSPNLANNPVLVPNPHLTAEMAACSSEPADCYCAVPSAVNCQGGAVAGLWRKGNAAPPAGKLVSFQCVTP